LVGAHGAEADINATYEVLLAQLEKYENVEIEKQGRQKSYTCCKRYESLA
jgi:DNA polymerase-3 subunit epsilon